MSFRRRVVLLASGAVAAAVVLASVVVYVVTRDELRSRVDATLRAKITPGLPQSVKIQSKLSPGQVVRLEREGRLPPDPALLPGALGAQGEIRVTRPASRGGGFFWATVSSDGRDLVVERGSSAGQAVGKGGPTRLVLPRPTLGGPVGYVQLYRADGKILRSEGKGGTLLPVTQATRAVATGHQGAFFTDAVVAGTHVRMLTERARQGGVWQIALPLTDVDNTLGRLKLVLALVSLGGIALAGALGLLVSRAALVPVRRLTGAAEQVASTQDLGHRIVGGAQDELGRLAGSFNSMLAALERSRLAQRQLVSDASHELRTPLTSIQANLDALSLGDRLAPADRDRAIASAQAQLRELTVLVGDLVSLSKTGLEEVELEEVRLDRLVAEAVERARLHAPDCRFELALEPCLVRGAPAKLDRAIANLLDNACKWSTGGPVEVDVSGSGALEVHDRGPGIAAEDLPRVFDRFFRAPAARGRPGSGLGLAIVRQVAELHGGTVRAANDPDGGARLTLKLPALELTPEELAPLQQAPPPR
jgi:two-component system, OmpR family, sensor histidine kinase MprB